MSEKKFEVPEGRLAKIVEFVAECMKEEVGLKFPKKGLMERVKVTPCWDDTGASVELKATGKENPEVWFSVCAGLNDIGEMPDAYIISHFSVWSAPWDSFGRLWSLDGDYAFMEFNPGTDEILDVSRGNEMDFDDESSAKKEVVN